MTFKNVRLSHQVQNISRELLMIVDRFDAILLFYQWLNATYSRVCHLINRLLFNICNINSIISLAFFFLDCHHHIMWYNNGVEKWKHWIKLQQELLFFDNIITAIGPAFTVKYVENNSKICFNVNKSLACTFRLIYHWWYGAKRSTWIDRSGWTTKKKTQSHFGKIIQSHLKCHTKKYWIAIFAKGVEILFAVLIQCTIEKKGYHFEVAVFEVVKSLQANG